MSKQIQLTDAEWKIMEILWDHSPQPMGEITRALEPSTGWTRHTVITLLKRMQEKGSVAVDDTGSVKQYTPRLTQEEASAQQTHRLLNRVFAGKGSLLINNLVESGEMTVEEIKEILSAIEKK